MRRSPAPSRAVTLLLLGADVVGLWAFFNLAHRLRIGEWLGWFSWPLAGLIVLTLLVLYIVDVYGGALQVATTRVPLRTLVGVASAGGLLGALMYMAGPWEKNPLFWRGVLPVALIAFAAWAALTRYLAMLWMRDVAGRLRWLVLGDGVRAARLWQDFRMARLNGELCFLTDRQAPAPADFGAEPPRVLGPIGELDANLGATWSGVVIATESALHDELVGKLMRLRFQGVRVFDLTDFYEMYLAKIPVLHLQDGWFVLSHGFDLLHHNIALKAKRVADVLLSALLLVPAVPLGALVAMAVKLDSRGPVLYAQVRTGQEGREFTLYKFRTMVEDAERTGAQWAAVNDPRVTRVGRILRAARLDEIPQLWNVIRGEMSFVGPRPERPDFNRRLEQAVPYYDLRHLVKPGITGWAQVKYPYGASVEDALEKLQYDLYYIKNYSILLDVMIVLKTLRVIVFGQGR